jgi:hypothetical protein
MDHGVNKMESEQYTEITHESWFGRMGKAIGGVGGGLILLAAAAVVLFWNEGRSVRRYQTLDAGQKAVISIAPDTIDPEHDGRLVHLSDEATTTKPLQDPEFGLSLTALRLQRVVEMYQWTEDKQTKERKKVGGGKEKTTTYRYQKRWVDHCVDHKRFKKPAGHRNPAKMPYTSQDFISINARLGAFRLPPTLVQRIQGFADVEIDGALIPGKVPSDAKRQGAWLYFGPQPGTPTVGDVRVCFRAIYPSQISVVAQQQENRLTPHETAGGELVLVQTGTHSAEALFDSARSANTTLTWALRLGGTLLMGIGFLLVLGPLATMADVIPILGAVVGLGTGIAAATLATALSLSLIAAAWIWHRPLLGGAILAAVGLLAGLLWWKRPRPAELSAGGRPPAPPGHGAARYEAASPHGAASPDTPVPPPPPEKSAAATARTAVDHLKEGINHLRAGDLDTALTALSTAIQKDGELGAAYYFRGVVQSRRREKSAAVKNLQIAARLGHGKAREALTARRIAWQ